MSGQPVSSLKPQGHTYYMCYDSTLTSGSMAPPTTALALPSAGETRRTQLLSLSATYSWPSEGGKGGKGGRRGRGEGGRMGEGGGREEEGEGGGREEEEEESKI